MKKALVVLLFSIQLYQSHLSHAQGTEVKYLKPSGNNVGYLDLLHLQYSSFPIFDFDKTGIPLNSGPILKIKENEFFIVGKVEEKRLKEHRKITKYNHHSSILCDVVIAPKTEKEEFHQIIVLKDNFLYITALHNPDSTIYYGTLVNENCEILDTYSIFKTKNAKIIQSVSSADYFESSYTFFVSSADETHFIAYYNIKEPMGWGTKNLKELIQFTVFDSNANPKFERQITLPYLESNHNVKNLYFTKNNQLITFSQSYSSKRDHNDYLINIFGQSPDKDKELIFPYEEKELISYEIPVFNTFEDGKIGFSVLVKAHSSIKSNGILVGEIDENQNTIEVRLLPYSIEYITHINNLINEKSSKKDPGIYSHSINNVFKSLDGTMNVLLHNSSKGISIFELKNLKLMDIKYIDNIQLFFHHFYKDTFHLFDLYPGKFHYVSFKNEVINEKDLNIYNKDYRMNFGFEKANKDRIIFFGYDDKKNNYVLGVYNLK